MSQTIVEGEVLPLARGGAKPRCPAGKPSTGGVVVCRRSGARQGGVHLATGRVAGRGQMKVRGAIFNRLKRKYVRDKKSEPDVVLGIAKRRKI